MRTTLTISDDIYRAARNLAALRNIGLGEAVSELARRGLAREENFREENGLPVFSVSEQSPSFGPNEVAEDDEA